VAVYFAAPMFARAGVIAGFVLEAPVYWGVPEPVGGPVSFTYYNADVTLSGYTWHIYTGFVHWVSIAGRVYQYVQQAGDSVGTITAALATAVNGAGDPDAVATHSGTQLTLTARRNTGAVTALLADGMWSGTLTQLAGGTPLTPTISKGVLFAQGTMYRPGTAPALPAAPANQQSWLFYSTTSGWYWRNVPTPTVSDDACVGWVVTNASTIVALSSRRIGTGEEAVITAGPRAISVDTAASGDTGVSTEAPYLGVAVSRPGVLDLGISFSGTAVNVAGVYSVTAMLHYIDELVGPINGLAAGMTSGATSLTLPTGGSLPVASPQSISFTYSNVTVGLVTIGPGYVHNLTIGAARYNYVQEPGDTSAAIAAAIAAAVNAAVDVNALATVTGAVVTLTPLGSGGGVVSCTASDGNAAQSLYETQPSYYLIGSELIEAQATNGSAIARGCLGTTAAAHALGDYIWQVQAVGRFIPLNGLLLGTTAWPDPADAAPFRGLGLVAAEVWATNEFGDSPVREVTGFTSTIGGRFRVGCGGQISLVADGVLGVESGAVTQATLQQTSSVQRIFATVNLAPVGADLVCKVYVAGSGHIPFAVLTIPDGTTLSNVVDITTTPSVDGLVIGAGAAVSLDVAQVGSTFPGERLVVTVLL